MRNILKYFVGISILEFLKLILKLLITLLVVFIFITIYRSLRNDNYMLNPIQMPHNLEDAGYDGISFANQVQDEIIEMKRMARSAKGDSTEFEVNIGQELNMQIMGLGISSTSLSYHVKDILGIKSKVISGELADIDHTLKLTLRLSGLPAQKINESYESGEKGKALDRLIKKAAEKVLFFTDPYRLAINKYREQDWDEAEKIIRYMIHNRPEDQKWAYLAWGNLYEERGKTAKGLTMFSKALELDPDFDLANVNVAWNLFQKEKYEEAIPYFEKGVGREPKRFGVNNGLAMSYLRIGNQENSEKYYKKNIEDFPNVLWAYANYSNFLLNVKNDTVGFTNLLRQAKQNVENNSDYYAAQAGSLLLLNKFDSVGYYIDLALDHNPEHVASLQMATSFYHTIKKDYQSAEPYLRKNIEFMEKYGYEKSMRLNAYNSLAMNDYYLGQYDSALVHVDKAIALDSENPFPWSTKAETYSYMGNDRRFYQYLDSAIVRGFDIDRYKEEEPYQQYAQQASFVRLLEKQQKLKN